MFLYSKNKSGQVSLTCCQTPNYERRMKMKQRFVFIIVNVIAVFANNAGASDYGIPQKTDDNIVVASYNIKWLGQAKHDLNKLAIVIEHFDVCGILEVKDEGQGDRQQADDVADGENVEARLDRIQPTKHQTKWKWPQRHRRHGWPDGHHRRFLEVGRGHTGNRLLHHFTPTAR